MFCCNEAIKTPRVSNPVHVISSGLLARSPPFPFSPLIISRWVIPYHLVFHLCVTVSPSIRLATPGHWEMRILSVPPQQKREMETPWKRQENRFSQQEYHSVRYWYLHYFTYFCTLMISRDISYLRRLKKNRISALSMSAAMGDDCKSKNADDNSPEVTKRVVELQQAVKRIEVLYLCTYRYSSSSSTTVVAPAVVLYYIGRHVWWENVLFSPSFLSHAVLSVFIAGGFFCFEINGFKITQIQMLLVAFHNVGFVLIDYFSLVVLLF